MKFAKANDVSELKRLSKEIQEILKRQIKNVGKL